MLKNYQPLTRAYLQGYSKDVFVVRTEKGRLQEELWEQEKNKKRK